MLRLLQQSSQVLFVDVNLKTFQRFGEGFHVFSSLHALHVADNFDYLVSFVVFFIPESSLFSFRAFSIFVMSLTCLVGQFCLLFRLSCTSAKRNA